MHATLHATRKTYGHAHAYIPRVAASVVAASARVDVTFAASVVAAIAVVHSCVGVRVVVTVGSSVAVDDSTFFFSS